MSTTKNPNQLFGPGGAPLRPSTIPDNAQGRKERPVASGVLDYFPDAIVALAQVSWKGNEQHNPGQSLRWDRAKSGDESDCLMRHFMQRGTFDNDGLRHSAKMAWRALALLQKEIEQEELTPVRMGPYIQGQDSGPGDAAVLCRWNNGTQRFEDVPPTPGDGTANA